MLIECIAWHLQQWDGSFLTHGIVSDPQFYMTHCAGIPLVTRCNSDGVDQTVVPKSGGFHELLIKEHYVTPLAGHLGIWKLTHALFQRLWWPKLHEIVTSFVHSCMTYAQKKNSTTVTPGLLQPLTVPESYFSSWSIDFTTDLLLSYGCNTILTCVDHLTEYTIFIPYKMGI